MILSKYLPAVRRFGSYFIYQSGIYSIHRRVCVKNKMTFIFYHDITDHSPLPTLPLFIERRYFWQHIRELTRKYSVIGISDYLSGGTLPSYPLIITFDGYSYEYLKLAEELSHRDVKALFYLQTEPILTGRPHWRQQLYFLFQSLKNVRVNVKFNNELFSDDITRNAEKNIGIAQRLAQRMEYMDNKHEIVYQIARRYGVNLKDFDMTYRPLSPDEVGELSTFSGIEVGSHSHTHTVLEDLEAERCIYELETSKQLLEKWTNKPVYHYAYPSGFINKRMPELLQQAGYLTATTTKGKLHEPYSSAEWPYLIPRYAVSNAPFPVLAGHLTGWERSLDALIKLRRKLIGKSDERQTKID